MPGNHDLGLHLPSAALASYGRERFQEAFGPTMGEKEWGGWDVVWIDSMALLENAVEAAEAREWIERVGRRMLSYTLADEKPKLTFRVTQGRQLVLESCSRISLSSDPKGLIVVGNEKARELCGKEPARITRMRWTR